MSTSSSAAESESPHASGLSPTLLQHAGSGQPFLGFISYRRGDGLSLARWLRDRITGFKAPPELKETIAARDVSVGGPQNRVFLDMSYQKPNVDFWDEHIAASLCRSRTLLVLQTPSVFDRLPNGERNWCEREIDTFLNFFNDPARILVVMCPGAPIDRFPAPLERISSRWDWVDLRFFSASPLSRRRHSAQYDPQVAKILAKIFDIEDGDLPILNREFARARAKVRRNMSVAAGAVMLGLSGLSTWALIERSRAVAAEHLAVQQRDEAVRQRNAALISQSRYLAKTADGLVADGTVRGAIALLRQALPDPAAGRKRPLVEAAIASAYNALFANHERGQLPMPKGAVAITTDGTTDRIVIATANKIYIRHGLTTAGQRVLSQDFGPPTNLVLSPDGKRLAMIGRNGSIAVRDLQTDEVLARNKGEGTGTRAVFLDGGRNLLIMDGSTRNLHLINLATGQEVASRTFSGTKTVVSLIVPKAGMLAFIDTGELTRISTRTLKTIATYKIDNANEYAMALSPDRSTIYVAAANTYVHGKFLALDSSTLTLERSFGRIVWGAQSMSLSGKWHMLALHGHQSIDFYDLNDGERISHVAVPFPMAGGRFVDNSASAAYMAYGTNGVIRRWNPIMDAVTGSYETIDGGAIQQLVPLKDGSGFLSVSDRPSITNWSYHALSVAKEYSRAYHIKGIKLHIAQPMQAFDLSKSDIVTVAYADNVIQRRNLETGKLTVLKVAAVPKDPITDIVRLQNGVFIVSRASGRVEIYSDSTGALRPVGTVKFEPLKYLSEFDAHSAFMVSKSGVPARLDVSQPSAPKITILPALGNCRAQGVSFNFAVCLTPQKQIHILRRKDGKLIANWEEPRAGLSALSIGNNDARVAIGDKAGHVVVRALPDGKTLANLTIHMRLSAHTLLAAAKSGMLSAKEMAAAQAGKTKEGIVATPQDFALSNDGIHLAVGTRYGIDLINLKSESARVFPTLAPGAVPVQLAFSPHGRLLAAVERSKFIAFTVHDVKSGTRIALSSLSSQPRPELYALANGRGFVTIDKMAGNILVHPIFENPLDFVAYLAKHFPYHLTPAQKRFYFIN